MATVDSGADWLYSPQPYERDHYDRLWLVASPSGSELSGLQAVNFFKQSGVDINVLKQIWGFSSPVSTMNKAQFYCACRYIAIFQNGDLPIRKESLRESSSLKFDLPKFPGLVIPPLPTVSAPYPPITAEVHLRYHELFVQYDTDKDGFLSGQESVTIFSKSGLGVDILKKIWKLADNDADNRLTSKEFCIAFHLIVCVGKQGLELPPILPPVFCSFLENAPDSPKITHFQEGATAPASSSQEKESPPKGVGGSRTPLESKFSALPVPKDSLLHRSSHSLPAAASRAPATARGKGVETVPFPVEAVADVKSATSDLQKSIHESVGANDKITRATAASFKDILVELKGSLVAEKLALEEKVEAEKGAVEATAREVTEVGDLVKDLNSTLMALREEFAATLERRRGVEANLATVVAERKHLEKDILTIRDQMLNTQTNIQGITSQVMREESALSRTSADANNIEKQSRGTSYDLEEMEKDTSRLRKLLLDLTNDKLKLAGSFDEYQRRLTSLQHAKTKEEEFLKTNSRKLAELDSEKVALAKERDRLHAELSSAKNELSSKISELNSLSKSNIELLSRNEEISTSSGSLETKLHAELEAQKALHEQETSLLKDEMHSMELELKAAKSDTTDATTALSSIKGELESMRKQHDLAARSLEATKNVVLKAEGSQRDLQAEIARVKEESEVAHSKLIAEVESLRAGNEKLQEQLQRQEQEKEREIEKEKEIQPGVRPHLNSREDDTHTATLTALNPVSEVPTANCNDFRMEVQRPITSDTEANFSVDNVFAENQLAVGSQDTPAFASDFFDGSDAIEAGDGKSAGDAFGSSDPFATPSPISCTTQSVIERSIESDDVYSARAHSEQSIPSTTDASEPLEESFSPEDTHHTEHSDSKKPQQPIINDNGTFEAAFIDSRSLSVSSSSEASESTLEHQGDAPPPPLSAVPEPSFESTGTFVKDEDLPPALPSSPPKPPNSINDVIASELHQDDAFDAADTVNVDLVEEVDPFGSDAFGQSNTFPTSTGYDDQNSRSDAAAGDTFGSDAFAGDSGFATDPFSDSVTTHNSATESADAHEEKSNPFKDDVQVAARIGDEGTPEAAFAFGGDDDPFASTGISDGSQSDFGNQVDPFGNNIGSTTSTPPFVANETDESSEVPPSSPPKPPKPPKKSTKTNSTITSEANADTFDSFAADDFGNDPFSESSSASFAPAEQAEAVSSGFDDGFGAAFDDFGANSGRVRGPGESSDPFASFESSSTPANSKDGVSDAFGGFDNW